MNAFLERVALLRAEEQAEAEAARWRAESQRRESSLRRCTKCGKGVLHPTNVRCSDCNQRSLEAAGRRRQRKRAGDSAGRQAPVKAAALAFLATRARECTVADLAAGLETTPLAAAQAMARLLAGGHVRRVDRGLYVLVPR